MSHEFSALLSPIDVGPVRMRNRVYFAPHDTNFMAPNTPPNDRAIAYYVARARGGVAAIVTPNLLGVTASGMPVPEDTLTNSASVGQYRKCVEAVHAHDVRLLAQLTMVGRMGQTRPAGGTTGSASASRVDLAPFSREVPREMTVEDIRDAVRLFSAAARNAREAGFDGLEIMGAGGLLLHQFISPVLNNRTDAYGGNVEHRMRFPLEVIESVRTAAGADMAIGFKLAGDEFCDGGIGLFEARQIASMLESTGKLDYLTIVGGMYTLVPTHVPPMYYPLGCFVYLASEIRRVVRQINVNCMGRINDPAHANNIIRDGHAEMIGMVRALICDSEFVKKAREVRTEEIRQCVGCEEGCYGRFRRGLPITCAYNPEAGRELEFPIERAAQRKKVMVVGGGIAGLETARVAALRGHHVSLFEQQTELGGQINLAARAPRRDDFDQIPRYYRYQAQLLGIEVHLGETVSRATVERHNPDVVVLATGSHPRKLDVPGGSNANVVDVREVLGGKASVGHHVLVVAGEHGTEALSVADLLSERGHDVRVVTEFFYAGSEAPFGIVQALYTRLCRRLVPILTLAAVKEVRACRVVVRNVFSGLESEIDDVDTVVVALGGEPECRLHAELLDSPWSVMNVGDCLQPRLLPQITLDAARTARQI